MADIADQRLRGTGRKPTRRCRRRKRAALLLALALLAASLFVGLGGCRPIRYDGPPSDHFDGVRFRNTEGKEQGGLLWLLRFLLSEERGRVEGEPPETREAHPAERVEGSRVVTTFVNHATVLLQTEGFNLLTDPIWSERTSPVSGFGPERVTEPGLGFEDLPPLNAVLISHDHYDHLDMPTLERLAASSSCPFIVGLGVGDHLRGTVPPDRVVELDWWETSDLGAGLLVTFVPARHFSGRTPFDRDSTLWGGFVAETPTGSRIFYAGDSAYGTHFREIHRRLGPFRLALLPIGAYLPRWFMERVHMDPAEALRAHADLGSPPTLGVHFGTFPGLASEELMQPTRDLAAAMERSGSDPERFRVLPNGGVWELD